MLDIDVSYHLNEKLFHSKVGSVLQQQLQEEEKLAKQQKETLQAQYKKLKIVDGIMADGSAQRLAREYDLDRPNE